MASSRIHSNGFKVAVTVAFIFSIAFLLPTVLVGTVKSGRGDGERWLKQSKMVLGSKPPGCVNKCLSCRPCMPTLVVIPSHDQLQNLRAMYHGDREDDDRHSYYLLSWKCKCGDKIFEP